MSDTRDILGLDVKPEDKCESIRLPSFRECCACAVGSPRRRRSYRIWAEQRHSPTGEEPGIRRSRRRGSVVRCLPLRAAVSPSCRLPQLSPQERTPLANKSWRSAEVHGVQASAASRRDRVMLNGSGASSTIQRARIPSSSSTGYGTCRMAIVARWVECCRYGRR